MFRSVTSFKNGQYRVVEQIGAGTFGEAFQVIDRCDRKIKVVKKVIINFTSIDEVQKEALTLIQFNHPFILKYINHFRENNYSFIVVEYCEGKDLRHQINEYSNNKLRIPIKEILTWFSQIACGINYLHEKSFMHRDLKPDNVFLKGGQIKIGDFGLSKSTAGINVAFTQCGTPLYSSPELIKNSPYSCKSDIWSLGITLYELCELKRPFEDVAQIVDLKKQTDGISTKIYPEKLNKLCKRLLCKKESERFTSVQIKVFLLEKFAINYENLQRGEPIDIEKVLASKKLKQINTDNESCSYNQSKKEKNLKSNKMDDENLFKSTETKRNDKKLDIIELQTINDEKIPRDKSENKKFKGSLFTKMKKLVQIKEGSEKTKERNHTEKFKEIKVILKNKENIRNCLTERLNVSLILNDKDCFDLVKLCEFPKGTKYRLIYRRSSDGSDPIDFHRKCDNIHNTLTIIKTDKNFIFGGYTSQTWNVSDNDYKAFKEDTQAFIFSLKNEENKQLKFKVEKENYAIMCLRDMGPCFGIHDFYISRTTCASEFPTSYLAHDIKPIQNFLTGYRIFYPIEIEVYEVQYSTSFTKTSECTIS